MKKLFGLVTLLFFGLSTAHGAQNIKNLWEAPTNKRKKASIKKLWNKPKKHVAKKPKINSNTITKIKDSKNILQQTSTEKKQANQQLGKIARVIQKTTLENIAINKVLQRLKEEQEKSETLYSNAQTSISQYGGKIDKLSKTIGVRHKAYIKLLADQFALIVAMKALGSPTINTIVKQEAYEAYKKKNSKQILNLKAEIDGSMQTKEKLVTKQNKIKLSIGHLKIKRELYKKKQEEKKKLLARLAKKEEEYRAQLKSIMGRQQLLQQTLAKLNILRQSEIIETKRAEEARRKELNRRIAQRKQMQKNRVSSTVVSGSPSGAKEAYGASAIAATNSVKQYGSSYHMNSIKAYRGVRTISPLSRARVVKKFGTYTDPIYKIKIFNDNIVLKSQSTNAKVRNVLNGKVVYVGENSMLGKVVIVEHGNRLHTIYAALSRISPMLHVGSRVKKGVIIGRIKRKLIFQATQNSKYINPLRLIRL
jgi:murein DD-endopeptidase MepM/ murein hydrolase activator NlpD